MNTETISIKEGDKLIAEFMGINPLNSPVTGFARKKDYAVEPFGYFDAPDLKYHTSWDWLMPVVEKISKWYDEESDTVNVADFLEANLKIFNLTIFSSINEVWLACIEFINWHNQNKTHESL